MTVYFSKRYTDYIYIGDKNNIRDCPRKGNESCLNPCCPGRISLGEKYYNLIVCPFTLVGGVEPYCENLFVGINEENNI